MESTIMPASVHKFYELFWKDDFCREFFLVQKSELLEEQLDLYIKAEYCYLPRLLFSNFGNLKEVNWEKLERRFNLKQADFSTKLQNLNSEYRIEDTIENFVTNKVGKFMETVQAFHAEFFQNGDINGFVEKLMPFFSPLLTHLFELNKDGFEAEIFQLLKNNHLLAADSQISNFDELFGYIEDKVMEAVKKSDKKKLLEIPALVDLLVELLESKHTNTYLKGLKANKHPHGKQLYKKQIKLFDELIDMEVLTGGCYKTYLECLNCFPTYKGLMAINIKPDKFDKIKCPSCNKTVFYISPFKLELFIYKHIIHEDGILFFAIQHLLTKQNIAFHANEKIGSEEIDIAVYENDCIIEILEIKMFKLCDANKDKLVQNLTESISKIKKRKDKLAKITSQDWQGVPAYLITNIQNDEICRAARDSCRKDLQDYNIVIHTPQSFMDSLS